MQTDLSTTLHRIPVILTWRHIQHYRKQGKRVIGTLREIRTETSRLLCYTISQQDKEIHKHVQVRLSGDYMIIDRYTGTHCLWKATADKQTHVCHVCNVEKIVCQHMTHKPSDD
jgi:hypothetical protein